MRHSFLKTTSKIQAINWVSHTLEIRKQFIRETSAGKVMTSVFQDEKSVILLDFLYLGKTVNAYF